MTIYEIDLTSTAQSLHAAIGLRQVRTEAVGLQAPEGNAATAFFGDAKVQPFELRQKSNVWLPVAQLQEIFVKGTPGDTLAVMVL